MRPAHVRIPTKLLLPVLLLFFITSVAAQENPSSPPAPPLPEREVSGIILNEAGQSVAGAMVTLTSAKDSLVASSNNDGIFVFKKVKMAVFFITVKSLGYGPLTNKYLNSDLAPKIILDPLNVKTVSTTLKGVTVNGTPSVTYKGDTVEYRAADYKVRENANVDDLLKNMEGMEVSLDGTLTHQGEKVTKAKLNGKDFAGGDVPQAIKNLPADIVEKIQIIYDYGEQATRTGIKSGDPAKILNITTKDDRSVGNIAKITASAGNNDRYDERLFAQRLNGNKQLGVIGSIRNTVNGVANTSAIQGGQSGGADIGGGNASGSGGTTKAGGPAFNYRDQWSKALQVNFNYLYNLADVNAINNSSGKTFLTTAPDAPTGVTSFVNNNSSLDKTRLHFATAEFELTPDSANYLRIAPQFTYSRNHTGSEADKTYTGLQNQLSNSHYDTRNDLTSFASALLYQHMFKKPRRNISLQVIFSHGKQDAGRNQHTELSLRDSLQQEVGMLRTNRQMDRDQVNNNLQASLAYVEPLSASSQLEFNVQANYKRYKNATVTDSINPDGGHFGIDSLSNMFNYSFRETDLILNYSFFGDKYNFSAGIKAMPTYLRSNDISKTRSNGITRLYIIPTFRFQYSWSRQEQFTVSYTGAPSEPGFTEMQPIPDVTDPQNIIYGNPLLGPSFKHTVTARYNNYIANSRFNISASINGNLYRDQVVTNNILVAQDIVDGGRITKTYINQTRFVNLDGAHSIKANYNLSKQLNDRKYRLMLNGTILYNKDLALYNGVQNHFTTWVFSERFGPRIDPSEALQINPYAAFELNRSITDLEANAISSFTRTSLNLEGKYYFSRSKTWIVALNASKNFITGINRNLTKNPFVFNAYIEKEMFKRKNGILRVAAFDIFNQNNFINRTITPTGYTDTRSNALSRYVMVSFVLNLQKWGGTVKRNGKELKRRGDGSFIYE